MGRKLRVDAIAEVDIYKYAPWDLPAKSTLRSGDLKWYFFCPREKKYANGARMNRATDFGYWKTTGKDRPVHYNNEAVGMIKTLVFHRGKAPKGDRTDWVMHEYRIGEKDLANRGVVQDAYVLCIVFQKEGPGPRNGAQYGAPFKEEDWDDNEDEDVECMEVVSSAVHSIPVHNQISPLAASLPCVSDVIPPVNNMPSPTPENNCSSLYNINTLSSDVGGNVNLGHQHNENVEALPHLDGNDIYNNLGDLVNFGRLSEGAGDFSFSYNDYCYPSQSFPGDNTPFLELDDLDAPLNGPVEAGTSELIHTDGLYSNQHCYNPAQLSLKVNLGLSQCPSTMHCHNAEQSSLTVNPGLMSFHALLQCRAIIPLSKSWVKAVQGGGPMGCISEELTRGGSCYPWGKFLIVRTDVIDGFHQTRHGENNVGFPKHVCLASAAKCLAPHSWSKRSKCSVVCLWSSSIVVKAEIQPTQEVAGNGISYLQQHEKPCLPSNFCSIS
ncbi:hypothetical protein Pint_27279 [Pistacia integerrima]|uniref:Uncharacterized protein n=1 Tax=Pistacia integerrima TaxID=434235 RepID=A0ACC0YRC9_9ROSI|nr:hypothetical protein Pint_27279 [Pistacia integerrima]